MLLTALRNLFGSHASDASSASYPKFFNSLVELIKNPVLVESHMRDVRLAHSATDSGAAFARAYLGIENIIVSSKPPVVDTIYTPQTLREKVRNSFDIHALPEKLELLFLPEGEQQLSIYELSIKHLVEYISEYAGAPRVGQTLRRALPGGIFERIVRHDSVDYVALRKLSEEQRAKMPGVYAAVYGALYTDVATLFGKEKAAELCHVDYDAFKNTYDAGITSQFLGLMPEGVFELERLAYMSREDLERKIEERTKQLNELNDVLEKKVLERTDELKQKVESLDASNRLLMDRETELKAANEQLKTLDKLKTEFISVAAHQLRTPLTGLKWTLSTLLEDASAKLGEKQKQLLAQATQSNERVTHLVNELLEASSIEADKLQYVRSKASIEAVMENVRIDFLNMAQSKKIELVSPHSQTPLPSVWIDTGKIRSVIEILLENALQYSHNGGKVTLSAVAEGPQVTVSVQDIGIGIPEEQQPHIFDKFFRAENARRSFSNGSGLGLFIAKHIVEKHDGRIWFESTVHTGTAFHFTVPVQPSGE